MTFDDYDFDLPPTAIAQRPVTPRDAARLLEITPRALVDHRVFDLPDLLRPGDLLVLNDTRVIPSRLFGHRDGARVTVTLLGEEEPGRWRALARPAKRLKPGQMIDFAPDLAATVIEREGGVVVLDFATDTAGVRAALARHGAMPLPPYIKRPDGGDPRDHVDYQTVYATRPGAVAAPTAGLHFTPELLARLDAAGIGRVSLTLHVGAGTFLPVTTPRVEEHAMHAEWGEITPETVAAIARARAEGGRVVAVGTTSLRLLETAALGGELKPFAGETRLFITPGFQFRVADLLLTNFHLPRSTLVMLVAAFAGLDRVRAAYAHALERGYRFYSYGDCCLVHRAPAPLSAAP